MFYLGKLAQGQVHKEEKDVPKKIKKALEEYTTQIEVE
jgi:hypothetical protein